MAASLAHTTGHSLAGASTFSSSFLPQSQCLATPCNSSSSGRSFSGGCRGARCQTLSADLDFATAGKSLYELLGVEQGVGLYNIKSSYRKLARRYHPDVWSVEDREECTRIFLQVQDAYEVLSDPEQRAKYDYQLMNPLSPGAVGWGSAVRRSRDYHFESNGWRAAWQDQLAHFPKKQRQHDSWGSRMRAKQAQN